MTSLSSPVAIVDPFTKAFNAVAEAVKSSPSVTAIVDASNVVTGLDVQPVIDYRQAGDLPALIVMQESSDGDNLWSSSTTADFEMVISFRLMTGDERIGKHLNPMRWAIARALVTAGVTAGDSAIVAHNLSAFSVISKPSETTDIDRGWIAEAILAINLCIDHAEMYE